jgi:hypothetical protein
MSQNERERAARDHDYGAELHERNAARLERHGAHRHAARERRDAQARREAAASLRAGLDGC